MPEMYYSRNSIFYEVVEGKSKDVNSRAVNHLNRCFSIVLVDYANDHRPGQTHENFHILCWYEDH